MSQIILIYSLKDGVSREDFHDWVRNTDQPAMRALERVESFNTYETKRLLMGEGEPSVGYVEVFELSDLDGFVSEDMPGDRVQSVMGEFMGFAEAPEFIIADKVG